jgi:hypothetical protein
MPRRLQRHRIAPESSAAARQIVARIRSNNVCIIVLIGEMILVYTENKDKVRLTGIQG